MDTSFGAAAERYVPRPYAGRVLLLRAASPHFLFDALGPSYGWDRLVRDGVEILRVPGTHETLVLEPNASTLVRVLKETLDGIFEVGTGSARAARGDSHPPPGVLSTP